MFLKLKKRLKLENAAASNILSVNCENIQSSTPIPKRRAGRPPGAKNKHSKNKYILPKSDVNFKFGRPRKVGKKGNSNNKSVSKANNASVDDKDINASVDDIENIPSKELIAEFKEGKLDKSGCLSPVKKRYLKKVKKIMINPQNWQKIKEKQPETVAKNMIILAKDIKK